MNHNKWAKKILRDLRRMKRIDFFYRGRKVAEYRHPKTLRGDEEEEMFFAISHAVDSGRTFKIIT